MQVSALLCRLASPTLQEQVAIKLETAVLLKYVEDNSLNLSTVPQTVKILPTKFTPCPSFSSNKNDVS